MAKKKTIRGSSSDLASLLQITQRRTNQLADEKIITRQPEGDFILPEAVAEFYAHKYKAEKALDLMSERAMHEKVKRELSELDLRQRQRELHEATDVEMVLTDMLVRIRTRLLGIPMARAPRLAGLSKGKIADMLNKEIESALMELKDYSPTMFDDAGRGGMERGSEQNG